MKKVLIGVVVAVALIIWIASWFRTPEAVATSGAQPWPGGLGPLESAEQRYPQRQANEASVKLTTLAKALPKNDALDQFVARGIAKGELAIGNPPALPDVSAIRELLLREPIVWERYRGIGGDEKTSEMRATQMKAARSLVASALMKAHANDSAAWDDLHAVWNLARSLDPYPQMTTQTAAFSMARMINAVAWKMPLPAPAWFAELQQRDSVQRLVEAFHYSAASYWQDGGRIFPTKMLANSVDHDRAIAEALLKESRCDVVAPMNDLGVNLSVLWRRAFRYRAEREATANALRVREGKPIEAKSACSDGAWTFDGTTVRFSRDITPAPPDRPMALVLRVKP